MVALSDLWTEIALEGKTEPGWHARRIHSESACDMRAAIQAPSGTIGLLFEVSAKSVPPASELPNCVGFNLAIETMHPGPNGSVRLCLLLKDRRFKDIFTTLAEDVIGPVAGAPTEATGVRSLLGRLHTWQRFVSRFGVERLSDEELVGLFAELHFMSSEVVPFVDCASAVGAWRGPYGEPQDFRFRSVAVEVKASSARAPAVFRIANLDQMDPGSREILLVYHVVLDADLAAGQTLPELIGRIRSTLVASDAAAAVDFDASLIETGYLDIHSDAYSRRFAVRSSTWLNVANDFPRLTRGTVMQGVTDASYSVSLQACVPHTIDANVAHEMMQSRL